MTILATLADFVAELANSTASGDATHNMQPLEPPKFSFTPFISLIILRLFPHEFLVTVDYKLDVDTQRDNQKPRNYRPCPFALVIAACFAVLCAVAQYSQAYWNLG